MIAALFGSGFESALHCSEVMHCFFCLGVSTHGAELTWAQSRCRIHIGTDTVQNAHGHAYGAELTWAHTQYMTHINTNLVQHSRGHKYCADLTWAQSRCRTHMGTNAVQISHGHKYGAERTWAQTRCRIELWYETFLNGVARHSLQTLMGSLCLKSGRRVLLCF